MQTVPRTVLAAILLAVTLTACDAGGDDEGSDGGDEAGGATARFVAVDIDYAATPDDIPAGEVTVELVNDGNLTHNVTIEGESDGPVVQVDGGVTGTGSLRLEPGEYVAYCSVPGHRDAGMEVTVTVQG